MKDYYYLPERFDLFPMIWERHPEMSSHMMMDKMHYIIDTVYLKQAIEEGGKEVFRPLNSRMLRKVLTPEWAAKAKNILIEIGILECDNKSIMHQKSFGYRFTPEYRTKKFVRVPAHNKVLQKRIEKCQADENERAIDNHPLKISTMRTVGFITLEEEGAYFHLSQRPNMDPAKMERRVLTIENFWVEKYYTDKQGRFYHKFSGHPKDLRMFLICDNDPYKKLIAIDVASSQPCLATKLYKKDCPEKQKYLSLVKTGRLNEYINSKLEVPFEKEEMGVLKKLMFKHIWYGSNYAKSSEIASVFDAEFPLLWPQIRGKKIRHHRDFPIELQKIEAKLILDEIGLIIAEKYKNDPDFRVFTMHDCFVTTEPYVEFIKQQIEIGYTNYLGFTPLINVSDFN